MQAHCPYIRETGSDHLVHHTRDCNNIQYALSIYCSFAGHCFSGRRCTDLRYSARRLCPRSKTISASSEGCPGQNAQLVRLTSSILNTSASLIHPHSGTFGKLRRPSLATSTSGSRCSAASVDDCRDACYSSGSTCMSFGYTANSPSNSCTLYNTALVKQGYVKRQQDLGTVFYNKGCFVETCPSPVTCPAAGQNIVVNPSFEDVSHTRFGQIDPTPWEITGSPDADPASSYYRLETENADKAADGDYVEYVESSPTPSPSLNTRTDHMHAGASKL